MNTEYKNNIDEESRFLFTCDANFIPVVFDERAERHSVVVSFNTEFWITRRFFSEYFFFVFKLVVDIRGLFLFKDNLF